MTFIHLNDLLARFGDYPPERIRLRPAAGTATKDDALRQRRAGRWTCEVIEGVLIDLPISPHGEIVTARIAERIGASGTRVLAVGENRAMVPCVANVRVPSAAVYPWEHTPRPHFEGAPPGVHPILTVDVITGKNTTREMSDKRKDYFASGIRLVWFVDPRARTVEVYTAPDQLTTLTDADTLTGGDVLPGFAVPVAQLLAGGA